MMGLQWSEVAMAGLGTLGALVVGVFTLMLRNMIDRANTRMASIEATQAQMTKNMVTREELRSIVERLENRNHDDLRQIHSRLDALMLALTKQLEQR
jgi:hypothetical protein